MNLVESYLESGEQKVLIFEQEITIQMLHGPSKNLDLKDVTAHYAFLHPSHLKTKAPVIPVLLMRRYPITSGRPKVITLPNSLSAYPDVFRSVIIEGMKTMKVWQSVRIKFYFMTERQKLLLHIWTRDLRGNSIYQNFLID